MVTYRIVGSVHDPDLYFCRHLANRIKKIEDIEICVEGVLELKFRQFLDELRKDQPADLFSYEHCHIVLRDGKIIGSLMDFVEVAINDFGIEDAEIANTMQFAKEAVVKTTEAIKLNGRPAVFLELLEQSTNNREDEVYGKLIIELFEDICPKACSNFIKLCTGEEGMADGVKLSYQDCPIHRLVPNGWFQSGDIVDGSGNNSKSVFGDFFEDESFSVEFGESRGGIVGFSNTGPHNNGSQFFITLGPCEWMNCTKVGFGRLVQGYDILKKLNDAPCKNQRPSPSIYVGSCGLIR